METLNAVHLRDELRKMVEHLQQISAGYFGPGHKLIQREINRRN
jgi:hypothetical protein